jgi:hypothetical protein
LQRLDELVDEIESGMRNYVDPIHEANRQLTAVSQREAGHLEAIGDEKARVERLVAEQDVEYGEKELDIVLPDAEWLWLKDLLKPAKARYGGMRESRKLYLRITAAVAKAERVRPEGMKPVLDEAAGGKGKG